MMGAEVVKQIWRNRWLLLVASIWVQSCAGLSYVFGSLSPIIKTSFHYNQKQINRLGVAKDFGGSVGLLAGSLTEVLPPWGLLLIGVLQNLVGYGWLWLVVSHRAPTLPFWMICGLLCIGANSETYFNTAALVSCVKSFPKSRGPIVGILKGFAGLSGAIFTLIYVALCAPHQTAFIVLVAVGPPMVIIGMMFVVRPIPIGEQKKESDSSYFNSIYGLCMLLAAYLMAVMLMQDLFDVKRTLNMMFFIGLLILLLLPLALPLISTFSADTPSTSPATRKPLLQDDPPMTTIGQQYIHDSFLLSEIEDEKTEDVDLLSEFERRKRLSWLQSRLLHAAAEGAVRIKGRKRPRRGEDFTLMQALIKADFWLLFFALLFGAGSGLTVIDNLGQLSQSLGYDNSHIFVSMISIWNFLGRVGGGSLSEIVARDYAYPRPVTMAAAQVLMAIGHFLFAMGWPGSPYTGTLLVGLGYGALWSITPATLSELFGLKKFGVLYNFVTMANPIGSLIFSGLIAGSIYDWEAEKQHQPSHHMKAGTMTNGSFRDDHPLNCVGVVCFALTFKIMVGVCIFGAILSMILVYRTGRVYRTLYAQQSSSRKDIKTVDAGNDQKALCSV
ncbi:hypothetical protein SUGI_1039620 [Cryptomeria japonica]|uniref:protein NUCLEAR FUSION DEFECTIVE 4 n=1 Tax=Cryptomeria japonica TaxID=3369 RepID=UPI002414ADF7|nr:protein NUCLEAR FUSION DEFECTIVE 4 [Cryptomeria japonica]GLJ49228.1 hypothetical protein SUGI_1039620 [Cryptomeria japonica]